MKVLVACEASQRVCVAFRERGHEAYSCDVQMCSGGHPEWHIKHDVLKIINGNTLFVTCDLVTHRIDKWDLIIAHPPLPTIRNILQSKGVEQRHTGAEARQDMRKEDEGKCQK